MPDLSRSWLIFFLIISGQLLTGLISSLLILWGIIPAASAGTGPLFLINYVFGFIPFIIYVVLVSRKISRTNPDGSLFYPVNRLNRGDLKHIYYWPLMIITLCAFIFAVDAIPSLDVPDWFEKMMNNVTEGGLTWSLLTVGIAAPLLEEFAFRGMILRGLLTKYSPVAAIIWSAIFFGAVHLNPWQALPAFLFGLLFGWIYYRTGNLWTTILFHSLNNTMSILYSYLTPALLNVSSFKDVFSNNILYYIVLSAAIIIFVAGIFLINRHIPLVKNYNSK